MTQRTIKQDAAGRGRKGSKVSQPPQQHAEESSSQDTQAQDGPVQPLTDQFPTLVGFKADPPKDSNARADPGPSFPDRPTEPFPPYSDSQAGLSSDGTQAEEKLTTNFSHLTTNTQRDNDRNDDTAKDATPAGTKATQPRRVKPTPVPAEDQPSSSGAHHRAPSTRFEGGASTPRNNDPAAPSSQSTQQQEESDNLSKTIFARTGTAVEVPAARRSSEPPATGPASRVPTTKTGGSTWLTNDPMPPPEKTEEKGEKVIERKKSGKSKHGEKK